MPEGIRVSQHTANLAEAGKHGPGHEKNAARADCVSSYRLGIGRTLAGMSCKDAHLADIAAIITGAKKRRGRVASAPHSRCSPFVLELEAHRYLPRAGAAEVGTDGIADEP